MARTSGGVRFYLKDPHANKTTAVKAIFSYAYAQFTHYEKKLSIHPKYWNKEKQRVKQTRDFPGYIEFNTTLDTIENDILKVYRRFKQDNKNNEPSLLQLRDLVNIERGKTESNKSKKTTLFSFISDFLDQSPSRLNLNTGKQISPITIRAYRQTFRVLKEYSKDRHKKIDFDNINTDVYNDFSTYLKDRGFKLNTIGKHQRKFKTFLREAFEAGHTTNRDFEKRTFKVATEHVDSIYLSKTELELIENLDLSKNQRLEKVRDLFLVGCWTGLRFSDLSTLKSNHIIAEDSQRFLSILTQKTGTRVVVPIVPVVEKIIEKYSKLADSPFPKAVSNQKMNDYLKEIGKMIPELSAPFHMSRTINGKTHTDTAPKYTQIVTHTARRSFATNCIKHGISAQLVMKITGHKTETSFLKYLKLNSSEVANIVGRKLAEI